MKRYNYSNNEPYSLRKDLLPKSALAIVLAGMYTYLCVESHLCGAVENGYEVVVTDAVGTLSAETLEAVRPSSR